MKLTICRASAGRRFFIALSLSAVFFSLSLPKAFPAIIHIDPTFTGSSQNGSVTNPYNSWSKVSFTSGNVYLQKAGTSASTGSLSFTGKNNITISTYGTGSKPRITTSGNGNAVFYITNSYNITIKDIEITSTGSWTSGITFQGASSSNNLIKNVWIHNFGWGIRLLTSASGNRILDSRINDILDDGIFVQDADDIEIGYCTIWDINKKYLINPDESYAAGDGIQLNSNNSLYFNIHHNTIDHSSMGNKFCFYVWGNNHNGKLEYNTFIGSSVKNSNGVFLNSTSNTILVRNNIFKNGYYGIISYAENCDVNYNRFENNTVGIMISPGFDLNARNNVFYNNTKYGITSSYGTSVTLLNNIFNLTSSPAKAFYFLGQMSSNNNVFNKQYTGFINGYSSLNAWRNSTGNDVNSVIGNPAFTNPAAGDFHVLSTSAAINRGQDVNLSVDYYGNTVPQQGNPDAGIHEFSGTKSQMMDADSGLALTDSTRTDFSLYPNPSSGGMFRIDGIDKNEPVIVEAFNIHGNMLREFHSTGFKQMVIDLGDFTAGTYLLRIKSAGKYTTLKAIIP